MKRYILIAALAFTLTGTASANDSWLQTSRGMEKNLLVYGFDFRGVNNDVWSAKCAGRGYYETANGKRWYSSHRCRVGIYGDALAHIRVWHTGPNGWEYRARFLQWNAAVPR